MLYFLGYEVDEDLPWHSTISRTRQLYSASVFEQLFDHVFAQCVARGLVAGDTQVVDSAPVKANASLQAVREKQPAGTSGPFRAPDEPAVAAPDASVVTALAHQLRQLATAQARRLQAPLGHVGAQHEKARLLSNKTHYCLTDPDARISVKTGKARALNYLCSLAVDTAHSDISRVQADFADSRDSLHLPRLLTGLQQRLRSNELPLRELLADAGYVNGPSYALLEAQHITALSNTNPTSIAFPTMCRRIPTSAQRASACFLRKWTPPPTAAGSSSIGLPTKSVATARSNPPASPRAPTNN